MTERQFDREGSIANRIALINDSIERTCAECGRSPADVRLMAVTKTVEPARVNEAIAAGVTLLGENRAQELVSKYDAYAKENVEIHFIGQLQTNKVRQVIDKITMVQSLDSLSLAQELQRQCEKLNRIIGCLVEVNIGGELSKSGVEPEALEAFLGKLSTYNRIKVRGIMSIPPFEVNEMEKEQNFSKLHQLFVDMKYKKIDNIYMDFLSMGMSSDYLLAIKHGSNLVRLGTVIFGHRDYIGHAK